jgi:hypothetical protein
MALSNPKKKPAAEPKNPPADKVRVGLITASIWENQDANENVYHNVTFERRYKDGKGNWQSTHSYGPRDLLELSKAADLAHTALVNARNAAASEQSASQQVEDEIPF